VKAEGVTVGRDRQLFTMHEPKKIRTVKQIATHQAVHPVGTHGVIVEELGPRVWLVELRVPDESLEGDAWYDVVEVRPEEVEDA